LTEKNKVFMLRMFPESAENQPEEANVMQDFCYPLLK